MALDHSQTFEVDGIPFAIPVFPEPWAVEAARRAAISLGRPPLDDDDAIRVARIIEDCWLEAAGKDFLASGEPFDDGVPDCWPEDGYPKMAE